MDATDRNTPAADYDTSGVSATIHEDGAVLLHASTGRVYVANRTGASIWQALTQHGTLDGVADSMGREYSLPPNTAREQAARFLADLEAEHLITARVES